MAEKLRIGALISGGGTNLQAIIDSCENHTIDANILFVGSDNPNAKGLERARKRGIPYFVVNYASIIKEYEADPGKFMAPANFDLEEVREKQKLFPKDADEEKVVRFLKTRAVAEGKLFAEMNSYSVDLLVLAGYMRTLTPYFIDKFNTDQDNPRIMNIHPALLPAFPGTDGYGDTFRYGCKVGGCTVHFVDYGEDTGPIIGQKSFSIEAADTLDSIKKKGLALEWLLYPECIQFFAENRLKVKKMKYDLPAGQTMERKVVKIL